MLNRNELISKISNEITKKLIKLYGNKVKSIILYGSYAREDNDKYSDMNIMVLFDCPYNKVVGYRKDISKMASRIPFYQNVVKEGQVLYRSS